MELEQQDLLVQLVQQVLLGLLELLEKLAQPEIKVQQEK